MHLRKTTQVLHVKTGKYLVAAIAAVVGAAPPPPQQRYPQQAGLHQLNPLDYFIEQPVDNYYRPAEQKQVSVNGPHGAPARLESLEPDSEVELVPGVQQPQQPPQQNPVAPNIPGLVPGQRVFIVHMPVPGYSPGSIGGYQPVYIVAAAPQGNARFPGNVDPSGHGVVNPYAGYRGLVQPQVLAAPIGYQNRPYDLVAGQPVQADGRGPIHFSQNVGLQGPVNPAAYQGPVAQLAHPGQAPNLRVPNGAPAQLKQGTEEAKEGVDAKSNHRAQPLTRNKA
ncbi:hypothetical protein HF086_012585 [Spodoptera exigua]|uniref:Uncharacterized protein n=1 Tax=Spodoptera exigua TaxID=7107 RepID=A0A922M573_SPOEX|nr:hypothetical protein HF086_012585 [Spodoptera exigua]